MQQDVMRMSEYGEFESYLKSIEISDVLCHWLVQQMVKHGIKHPKIDTELNIIPDDTWDFLIEGTIRSQRFRLTAEDIYRKCEKHSIETYLDAAIAIDDICKHGPDVGNDILELVPNEAADVTRDVWQCLCNINCSSNNDQFVVKCFWDRSYLPKETAAPGAYSKFVSFIQSFARLNDMGAERALQQRIAPTT